jgi:hypothetical protein
VANASRPKYRFITSSLLDFLNRRNP